MRILHVISSMAADTGGPPRVVAHLAHAQARQGAAVHVFSLSSGEPRTLLTDLGIHWEPGANLQFSAPSSGSRGTLENAINQSDVIHVHGIWELVLQRALRAARGSRKGTVITPHGMVSQYGMRKKPLKKALAMKLYAKDSLECASFVHALTATEAREIGYYAPQANTRVVPNGIMPDEFAAIPDRNAFLHRLPQLADSPYVLFLARLDHMKGIDVLVEAFALVHERVPDLQLVIAGPDYGSRAMAIQDAERLGIHRHAHFIGPVYGDEKRALLAHALCVAQPSRHEGFSITLLEALASGTPLVVSDHVDLPGLLDERVGRVVPLQPEAVAGAIVEYAASQEPRAAIRARAQRLVREHYTWDEVARQLSFECMRHALPK